MAFSNREKAEFIAESMMELLEAMTSKLIMVGMAPEMQRILFAVASSDILMVRGRLVWIENLRMEDHYVEMGDAEEEEGDCETCRNCACSFQGSEGGS